MSIMESLPVAWAIGEDSLELVVETGQGIIYRGNSKSYGPVVIKKIHSWTGRYELEKSAYQHVSYSTMCKMLAYNDEHQLLLLPEVCEFSYFDISNTVCLDTLVSEIERNKRKEIDSGPAPLYGGLLREKLKQNYEIDMDKLVIDAIHIYEKFFGTEEMYYLHGDIHRFNILVKKGTGEITLIDPIGMIAPIEIEYARLLGTELIESDGNIRYVMGQLSKRMLCTDKMTAALYIDMIFRAHNTFFENQDDVLRNKWIKAIQALCASEYFSRLKSVAGQMGKRRIV